MNLKLVVEVVVRNRQVFNEHLAFLIGVIMHGNHPAFTQGSSTVSEERALPFDVAMSSTNEWKILF